MSTQEQKNFWRKIAEQHYADYVFILGMSVEQAKQSLKEKGKRFHIVKKDGIDQYGEMDLDDDRINVVVESDTIIGIDSIC